uniref:Transmembrane protein 230-like n=1 Tax=Poecilia reticulata TaxID=8081 RepID=A0A3P9QER6_POERE
MLTAGLSNNKVKYSRLAADDDGYIDLQFKKNPPKIPYKAIGVAVILFLIGSLLIILGALFLAGIINVEVSLKFLLELFCSRTWKIFTFKVWKLCIFSTGLAFLCLHDFYVNICLKMVKYWEKFFC